MNRTNSKGTRGKAYLARYLAHHIKRNRTVLLLGALFVLGVALGTLLVRVAQADTLSLLLRLVSGFVDRRREQGLAQNFTSGSVSSVALTALLFFCGFCAVAQPVIVAIPFFRGLGFGFSAASLYAGYGPGATGYVAAFLLPGMTAGTIILLLCCNEALRMSVGMLHLLRDRRGGAEIYSPRIYCARFLVLALLGVAAAFLEAALFFAFGETAMLM